MSDERGYQLVSRYVIDTNGAVVSRASRAFLCERVSWPVLYEQAGAVYLADKVPGIPASIKDGSPPRMLESLFAVIAPFWDVAPALCGSIMTELVDSGAGFGSVEAEHVQSWSAPAFRRMTSSGYGRLKVIILAAPPRPIKMLFDLSLDESGEWAAKEFFSAGDPDSERFASFRRRLVNLSPDLVELLRAVKQ